MKPAITALFFGVLGLLFLGCMGIGAPSPEEKRIAELEEQLNASMKNASEKMDAVDIYLDRGKYGVARETLSEMKTDLAGMEKDIEELCELTGDGDAEYCGPEGSVIAVCFIPMTDLLMNLTTLVEGVRDECGPSGCPEWVISLCEQIEADAEGIYSHSQCGDARVDPKEISELCDKMSELGIPE